MTAPARRTQAERRSASERALLRAAAELIAERGIERTSLRSIGARAGASRAMPAYHFGSKDGLIAQLARQGHELTMAATADAVARDEHDLESMPMLDALSTIIETYLEVFTGDAPPEERAVVVMWGATFPSESPLPAMVDSDRNTHRELTEIVRLGQDDGSVRRDVDAAVGATMVMGLARGVAALLLTHDDLADARAVRALAGETIRAALGVEQTD